MGLCVVGPVGLIGPLSGGLVGLVVQWIWWAVGLVVGPRVWWACGSGGFCGVLTAKSPTLRGPTCQGLLGLVFHLEVMTGGPKEVLLYGECTISCLRS